MKTSTLSLLCAGSAAAVLSLLGYAIFNASPPPSPPVNVLADTAPADVAAGQPSTAPPSTEAQSTVPPGWSATGAQGIYWRWCPEQACSTEAVIGDNAFVLAQVWCKDRACGDIYGRVNFLDANKVVVGWTNDTAYGDAGQVVQLTFDTHLKNWSTAKLTNLNVRG